MPMIAGVTERLSPHTPTNVADYDTTADLWREYFRGMFANERRGITLLRLQHAVGHAAIELNLNRMTVRVETEEDEHGCDTHDYVLDSAIPEMVRRRDYRREKDTIFPESTEEDVPHHTHRRIPFFHPFEDTTPSTPVDEYAAQVGKSGIANLFEWLDDAVVIERE